jgi:hypothetical protein
VKNTTNHSTGGEQRSTDGDTGMFIFNSLDHLFSTIEYRRTRSFPKYFIFLLQVLEVYQVHIMKVIKEILYHVRQQLKELFVPEFLQYFSWDHM